jgi:hypothetical protein
MKTDTEFSAPPLTPPASIARPSSAAPDGSFANMLKSEVLAAQVEARRNEVLDQQPAKKADPLAEDIANIREHGFRHYAEEVHKQKMEELREKILEAMGMTEEELAEMPAAQRQAIEDVIAREIEARMAANSMMNSDDKASTVASIITQQSSQFAAQAIAGEAGKLPGGAKGLAVMAALEPHDELGEGMDEKMEGTAFPKR